MTESQLITVPFHGNQLFIATHNDQPYAPMKPIVEGMGLDWRSQASKFRSNKDRWGVVLITTPTNGSDQDAICLPLRKLPGWLMTLQPSRIKPEIREKVVMYQNECDDALWDYWTKGHAANPRAASCIKDSYALAAALLPEIAEAIQSGREGESRRWFLSFDHQHKPFIQTIPDDACMMSHSEFLKYLLSADGAPLKNEELEAFINAATRKLASRAAFYQQRALAQRH